jgi:hypothetical protein
MKCEVILNMVKMVAPITAVVFVEQSMGPGSDAKASQIMAPLLILNLVLGLLSLINLMRAMKSWTLNKFTIAETILWGTKVLVPIIMIAIIERTMSPGSSARAAQLSPMLLIFNLSLGMASWINLAKAVQPTSDDQGPVSTEG